MTLSLKEYNFRLYGPLKSDNITVALNKLGIDTWEKFKKTGYTDVSILANDIENQRAIKINNQGQVIDFKNRIIIHSGNGVYHVINPVDKTSNTNAYIKHYIIDDLGNEHTTDYYGKLVLDFNSNYEKNNKDYNKNNKKHSRKSSKKSFNNKEIDDHINDNSSEMPNGANNQRQNSKTIKNTSRSNNVNIIGFVSSRKFLKKIHLCKENYIQQGIHLYYYKWNKKGRHKFKIKKPEYGLLKEEVEQIYPHLFNDQKYKYKISISKLECQQNHHLAKLGFFVQHHHWFNKYLSRIQSSSSLIDSHKKDKLHSTFQDFVNEIQTMK